MEIEHNNTTNDTERLQYLDTSIINEPSINKAKSKSKKERSAEIMELAKEINLSSDKKKEKESESTKKNLKISTDQNKYDIIDDVGKRMANITIGQLLELNPKLRSELSNAIRLTTIKDTVENILLAANKRRFIRINGEVENIETPILLDTCSSVNMITTSFLENNDFHIFPKTKLKETFVQAYNNTTMETELYDLEVKIGCITLKETFRLIERT